MLVSILSYSKIEFITLQREMSAEKFSKHAPGTALKFFRSRISYRWHKTQAFFKRVERL